MKIVNSYTMEASFAGSDFGKHKDIHFTAQHLEEMGHYFCDTLLDLWDPDQSRVRKGERRRNDKAAKKPRNQN